MSEFTNSITASRVMRLVVRREFAMIDLEWLDCFRGTRQGVRYCGGLPSVVVPGGVSPPVSEVKAGHSRLFVPAAVRARGPHGLSEQISDQSRIASGRRYQARAARSCASRFLKNVSSSSSSL